MGQLPVTSERPGEAARRPGPTDDEPVLPSVTRDELDEGWGDERGRDGGGERDEDWYRRERPPHHE